MLGYYLNTSSIGVNNMQTKNRKIVTIVNHGGGPSSFGVREIELNGSSSWMLSEQQSALNFRLRSSESGYRSDWHVAGDPTLLIITSGAIEIELRDGLSKTFKAGDMFIAEDYLLEGVELNGAEGHRARVVGGEALSALHLKLSKR
jgi:hypothetical protein